MDFDAVVTWCQTTNVWLASFQDTQQIMTRSFSLETLLGAQRFAQGREQLSWQFRLTREHFYNRALVRIRSIGARMVTDGDSRSWNLAFSVPDVGEVWHIDGSTEEIDQSHVGTIYLGRVVESGHTVLSEGAAPPRIQNASPIGAGASPEWTVSSAGVLSSGIDKDKVKDVKIHITVAFV